MKNDMQIADKPCGQPIYYSKILTDTKNSIKKAHTSFANFNSA